MKIFRIFLLIAFSCNLLNAAIQTNDEQESGNAYVENGNTAHWSAYVPLTILVAAAIFFGIADKKQDNSSNNSSDPYDALGNLSERRGSSYHNHHSHHGKGGYSHQ